MDVFVKWLKALYEMIFVNTPDAPPKPPAPPATPCCCGGADASCCKPADPVEELATTGDVDFSEMEAEMAEDVDEHGNLK